MFVLSLYPFPCKFVSVSLIERNKISCHLEFWLFHVRDLGILLAVMTVADGWKGCGDRDHEHVVKQNLGLLGI